MKSHQGPRQSATFRRWWEKTVSGEDTGLSASVSRLVLQAVSGLYWLGLNGNLLLYTSGLKRRSTPTLPAISIGNLTMGGTGKTTAAAFLARRLQHAGVRPAIVLRGYQGQIGREPVILCADEATTRWRVSETGDEACLLAQTLDGVPVAVGKRREAVIARLAENSDAQVVILDDGFQYFRMNRLADIVLIDATVDTNRQRLFPAGYLREPLAHLRRADQIWITHADLASPSQLSRLKSTLRQIANELPVVETTHQITGLRMLRGQPAELEEIRARQVLAVSAIGNPESFEQSLRQLGAKVTARRYADHHYYTVQDLRDIEVAARAQHADFVAITAKDAVKWPDRELDVPVIVVECQLQIISGQQAVDEVVDRARQAIGEHCD
ncbi:MAG: tetraacyldisaccharide 4'-kinase [Armatimonadetes bacterium]|nr:tetraacyldisaccharide 4'-kinase [Armatimonadota bacterium]